MLIVCLCTIDIYFLFAYLPNSFQMFDDTVRQAMFQLKCFGDRLSGGEPHEDKSLGECALNCKNQVNIYILLLLI